MKLTCISVVKAVLWASLASKNTTGEGQGVKVGSQRVRILGKYNHESFSLKNGEKIVSNSNGSVILPNRHELSQ